LKILEWKIEVLLLNWWGGECGSEFGY